MGVYFRLNYKSGKIVSLIVFIFIIVVFYFMAAVGTAPGNYDLPEVDNGYRVDNYNVEMVVNDDRSVDVQEIIDVYFLEASHGIYRYIPYSATEHYIDKNGNEQTKEFKHNITNFKVHNDEDVYFKDLLISTGNASGCNVYQIGREKSTVTGEHQYKLSYKIALGDDRDDIEDVFYYNIIGAGVNTTITNTTFSIKFSGQNIESENFKFYVGTYGEDVSDGSSRIQNLVISGDTLSGSVSNLSPWEAVTIFNLFEQGFFKNSINHTYDIAILVIGIIFVGLIVLFFALKRRKDPIVEIIEFKAPKGLTPTDAGYINDGELTGDDFSSLIVYWANKGYIKIADEAEGENMLFTRLVKKLPSSAKSYEKILFNALFEDGDSISSLEMTNLGDTGYKCKKAAEADCKKYFNKNTSIFFNILSIASIVLMLIPFIRALYVFHIALGPFFLSIASLGVLGFAICNIDDVGRLKDKVTPKKYMILRILLLVGILAPLIILMIIIDPYSDLWGARFYLSVIPILLFLICPYLEHHSEEGKEVLGHIRGLKSYILHAEKGMLEMFVKENPQKFYEILPYAYVLGVSKVYMDKFKDIDLEQPTWCSTSSGPILFLTDLNRNMDRMSRDTFSRASLNTPSGSGNSSGGFGGGSSSGGGGFSGGGSGGGGMGRW